MRITVKPIGMIGANACLIETDGKNVLIDPGGSPSEWHSILPRVDLILCTHGHFDHVYGADTFRAQTGAPLLIHTADAIALTDPARNVSTMIGRPLAFKPADGSLSDGMIIPLDERYHLQVIETPGHTPGGVCLLLTEDGQPVELFSGDTLFAGSIGRLDIGGDADDMQASLEKLMQLPDHVRVQPGHGPATTIGEERATNPYLRGNRFTR